MHRRQFLAASAGLAATLATFPATHARQATPASSTFPRVDVSLTDTGFMGPPVVTAGRTLMRVTNTGTLTESHWAAGRFPDHVTDAEIEAFMSAMDDTAALGFEDIAFIGVPDWPQPGGPPVTGIVDFHPGRYVAFDPFGMREAVRFTVEGEFGAPADPASDLTVTLMDMTIDLPAAAFTSNPVRWKIHNMGPTHHDVAVLPVPADFTEDHFMTLMTLPEGTTPPPDIPAFDYLPVAAIGILCGCQSSWLDVQLAQGRYLAVCMLPFGTGYPHAMDGMYDLFDVP